MRKLPPGVAVVKLFYAAFLLFSGAALSAQELTGTWQGTMQETPTSAVRTVVKIVSAANDTASGMLYRLDPDAGPIPVSSITLQGKTVRFLVPRMDVTYEGRLSTDGGSIAGTWTHGATTHPLLLIRVTAGAAWALPAPPASPREMAANANPGFDVATIKPSAPGKTGESMDFEGRHFKIDHYDVNDLLAFAYGLHAHQIVGAPAWFATELYDIDGVPDVEGEPDMRQLKSMVQKLLADRFHLMFHHDTRVLAVYALTVDKSGLKLTRSGVGPNDEYGFSFPRGLGTLQVRNLTMAEFSRNMQAFILDKPVVDQTRLTDRYDFNLNWTPDESQFNQFRSTGATAATPATEIANAPPSLYTAMHEQLGLKLEPVKIPTDVIVIDKVERPSPN